MRKVHEEPAQQDIQEKGLQDNAIGLVASVVIGLASTAPAYSLAATLGFVVVAVGIASPAMMIVAFVPMLLTAFAYRELNRVVPDCGTTFTWSSKAFGPKTGWIGGWGLAVAGIVVLANLTQITAIYLYRLVGLDGLAESTLWVTVAGCLLLALMTYVTYRGIEITSTTQNVLTLLQIAALVLFSVVALFKAFGANAPAEAITPSLSWFNPLTPFTEGFGWAGFTEAFLLSLFIYWGWDTVLSVNEETTDKEVTPGLSAVVSTVILLGIYVVVTTAAQAYGGVGETGLGLANEANADDVLGALGPSVLGVLDRALIFAIVVSAAASTITTILPTARSALAMGIYRALPESFTRIHPRFRTPTVGTIFVGAAGIVFYAGMTLISTDLIDDTIASIGLSIAFYYGMTAFACAWYFRDDIRAGRGLWIKGILPLLGGLMMLAAFLKSAYDMWQPDYGTGFWTVPGLGWEVGSVFLLGVGSLLLGFLVMFAMYLRDKRFFRGETLHRDTPVLAPD